MKGLQGNKFNVVADFSTDVDPRVTPLNAKKGTLVRYIPTVGDVEFLVKQDNGSSTNFTEMGGGGAALILSGVTNPDQAPGVVADEGVLYVNTASPSLWQKTGPGDTDWAQFDETTGDVYVKTTAVDPSIAPGLSAPVGAIALLTVAGSVLVYQKNDVNDTDWIVVGGSSLSGSPNAIVFFDSLGDPASSTNFTYDPTVDAFSIKSFGITPGASAITATGFASHARGRVNDDGVINATGNGSTAHGNANGAGSLIEATASGAEASGASNTGEIIASGVGSRAKGYATSLGTISATSDGADASGRALRSSTVTAGGEGATARGYALNGGQINVSGNGSVGMGVADNGSMTATEQGSVVHGFVNDGGSMMSAGIGSFVSGYSFGGTMVADSDGSSVFGHADSANMQATGQGSSVFGFARTGSSILASTAGATAMGRTENNGNISSQGNGSLAGGYSSGASASILASGPGSFARGNTNTNSVLSATNFGSFIHGSAIINASMTSSGRGSVVFGFAQTAGSITATQDGAFAVGSSLSQAVISAAAVGAMVFGSATDADSSIRSAGEGSLVFGRALNGGILDTTTSSSLVFGEASGAGSEVLANMAAISSMVFGRTFDGGAVRAHGSSTLVFGSATNSGSVFSGDTTEACLVIAKASTGSARTEGNALGSSVFGYVDGSGSIIASGIVSSVRGYTQNAGAINANGTNSAVKSYSDGGQAIVAGQSSSLHSHGTNATVNVDGNGSHVKGVFSNSTVTVEAFYSDLTLNHIGGISRFLGTSNSIVSSNTHDLNFSGNNYNASLWLTGVGQTSSFSGAQSIAMVRSAASVNISQNTSLAVLNFTNGSSSTLGLTLQRSLMIADFEDGNDYNGTIASSIVVGEQFFGTPDVTNAIFVGLGHTFDFSHAVFGEWSSNEEAALKVGNGVDDSNRSDAVIVHKDGKQKFASREYVNYREISDENFTITGSEKIFYTTPDNTESIVTLPTTAGLKNGEIVEFYNVSGGTLNVQANSGQTIVNQSGVVASLPIQVGRSYKLIFNANTSTWFALGAQ